jgi:hypothetical protein
VRAWLALQRLRRLDVWNDIEKECLSRLDFADTQRKRKESSRHRRIARWLGRAVAHCEPDCYFVM